MTTLPSDKARENLNGLIEQVALSHEPVQIQAASGAAVLVGEEDWRAMQESLYLLSIPGMRESIRAGLATSVDECAGDPGW